MNYSFIKNHDESMNKNLKLKFIKLKEKISNFFIFENENNFYKIDDIVKIKKFFDDFYCINKIKKIHQNNLLNSLTNYICNIKNTSFNFFMFKKNETSYSKSCKRINNEEFEEEECDDMVYEVNKKDKSLNINIFFNKNKMEYDDYIKKYIENMNNDLSIELILNHFNEDLNQNKNDEKKNKLLKKSSEDNNLHPINECNNLHPINEFEIVIDKYIYLMDNFDELYKIYNEFNVNKKTSKMINLFYLFFYFSIMLLSIYHTFIKK